MGFFKDLVAVNKISAEVSRNRDTSALLAQTQQAMVDANATMMAMTARLDNDTVLHGTPGIATVTAARQTGQFFNMHALVQLDLLVQVGGMPMPVTITELVPQLQAHRVQPGSTLSVRVGANPGDVVVDWDGVR